MRNILSALLGSSVLLLSAVLRADVPSTPTPLAPTVKPASSEVTQVAQEEVVRRQAAQIQARTLIEDGTKLVSSGKLEAGVTNLESAINILPNAKATETDRKRATHTLSLAYTQLAEKALKANDGKKAIELAKKAIENDSGNRDAEQIIVRAKKGSTVNPEIFEKKPDPAHTPEFLGTKDQIKKLFREGKILLNSGQYDEAEKRFQQVLLLDPYSTDAQEMLQIVNDARHPSTLTGQGATRRRMLWQADSAWLLPTGGEVKRPELETSANRLQGTGLNQSLLQKLNDIKFPEIKFRDAALVDVVTYLSEQSRTLDPKGEGVNIVLGPGLNVGGAGAEAAPAAPAAGADAAAPAAAAAPVAGASPVRPITIMLRNIPMIEALNLIAPLANLKYRLNANAVVLLPLDAPTDVMITKSYPISASAFSKFVVAPEAAGGGGGGGDKIGITAGNAKVETIDVKTVFAGLVDFPTGSAISFNEKVNLLMLKNTPENIEQFEKILPNFTGILPQVEIEAKFIDISQGDLDELGFQWGVGQYNLGSFGMAAGGAQANGLNNITDGMRDSSSIGGSAIAAALGGGSAGSAANKLFVLNGILTDPQFQVILKALSQKQSTDVLSAPKVTTETSVAAELKVVQEFIYPTEYSTPTAGTGGSPGTGSIPSGFKTREVGVILQVTPQLQPDGYSIELKLNPQVVDFLGFVDYSPPPQTYVIPAVGTAGTAGYTPASTGTLAYKIQQPLFSTRSVATSVVVFDGQTVVLGGLIKESISKIDDKVPFLGDLPILGRFFQSKVTNRSKENLLIFVTARLIGPNGLPIHPDIAHGGLR